VETAVESSPRLWSFSELLCLLQLGMTDLEVIDKQRCCHIQITPAKKTSVGTFSLADIVKRASDVLETCKAPYYGGIAYIGHRTYFVSVFAVLVGNGIATGNTSHVLDPGSIAGGTS